MCLFLTQIQLIWAPTGQRKVRRSWITIWPMQPAVGPLPLLDKAAAKHSQSRHRRVRHNEQHITKSVRRPTVDAQLSRLPWVQGPDFLSILRVLPVLRSSFESSTRLRFVEGRRTGHCLARKELKRAREAIWAAPHPSRASAYVPIGRVGVVLVPDTDPVDLGADGAAEGSA